MMMTDPNCNCISDDDVVITGISGRFPQADNMEELKEVLFSKKQVITNNEDRWSSDLPGFPTNRLATIKDLSKFDNNFFNISKNVANAMDPMQRMLLEVSYEAIVDAGYNLKELKGRHVGVIIGLSDSDATAIVHYGNEVCESRNASGYLAGMAANRISHKFDFLGASFPIDTACSSSGCCLYDAFRQIRDGSIEAAIVGGTNLCLDPRKSKSYLGAGILSPTGESRVFDENNDGLVKGESVAALFLQRRKDARRVYAKILNVECMSAGHNPEGIFVPSLKAETYLFRKSYEKIGIDPRKVTYVEAHGTGTKMGDVTEVNAIDEVFCKGRKTPLQLGAIKSNLGHSEGASAICSIAKVVMSFETGIIPPNINYEKPIPNCPGLLNGNIKVITEPTPLESPLAAVNNFGFGGINVHIVLQRNVLEKQFENGGKGNPIPKLVVYSATTEKALTDMFSRFHENTLPREFYSLLNRSAYNSAVTSPYRGYTILQRNGREFTSVENVLPIKRPVWFIFSGMGSQWPGMAFDLMQLEVFSNSMKRSAQVLAPLGIDLLQYLQPDKSHLQEIKHITPAFTSTAAIQIALVDVLKSLGIEPDGVIGHSTGELLCAYCDDCATAEETILSAYYRGYSLENTEISEGAMVSVGLSWDQAKEKCPPGVYLACDNTVDNVTLSGAKSDIDKFAEELKAENVFVRSVYTHGYGFHCRTISDASELLCTSLQRVYKDPKPRSKRWISTCFSESDCNAVTSRNADCKYFTHNLISPVLFREALSHVPLDSVVIEVGPHTLLQSLIKRGAGSTVSVVGLMKKHKNNVDFLLSSIGKLFTLGLDPKIENLYPPVTFPVPRGTPMISPLIQWDHSASHYVPKFSELKVGSIPFLFETSSSDRYLLDHCIDGRSLFPATGYIYLAWRALSDNLKKNMTDVPIVIENFKIARATILSSRDDKSFEVSILNPGGAFEIAEGGSVVASGRIYVPSKASIDLTDNSLEYEKSAIIISGREMYDELKIHGYEYGPEFQGLLEVNIEGTSGMVKWNGKWISFLDSLLLFFGLIYENSDFKLPTGALSVKIDPRVHKRFISGISENGLQGVPVKYDKYLRKCKAPGVEIRSLILEPAPRRSTMEYLPVHEEYNFKPYYEEYKLCSNHSISCEDYIQLCCHLTKEITKTANKKTEMKQLQSVISETDLDIEACLKFADKKCTLLRTLQGMREMARSPQFVSRLGTMIQNLTEIIAEDLLFKAVLNEKPLRSLLDVAIENCFGNLNVIELCDARPKLLPDVQNLMKSFSQAKASFVFVDTSGNTMDAADLSDNVLVEKTNNSSSVPSNFKDSGDLVLTSFILGVSESLSFRVQNAASLTKEGGFILFLHKRELKPPESFLHYLSKQYPPVLTEAEVEKQFVVQNLLIVSRKSCSTGVTAYLLRKPHPENPSSRNQVLEVRDGNYEQWVDKLKNHMSSIQDKNNPDILWLVAQDTPVNGLIGMMNCLKQEPGGNKIRCIFTNGCQRFDPKDSFFADVLKKNLLMNVYQNGQWGSFRHNSLSGKHPKKSVDMAYMNCTKLGDLSSFMWLESSIKNVWSDHPEKQLYHVYYSSINFRDVMLATGKLAVGALSESGTKLDGCVFGMEFSGRDAQGRRIMAMVPQGAFSTTVLAKPTAVYDVPDHWSLEEAATVPVVYSTGFYALILRGRLCKGEKVLIHSGTGGVGQAAIRICLSLDCEVFATVGTQEKRNFLIKTFPQLKPQNIGCSRNTTFEEMIMTKTEGKGVDVVLNSLADDKFQASVRCLAKHGRFLEIGKYDISLDHSLGLRVFLKDVDFKGVMLDSWFSDDPENDLFHQELKNLMNDGIKSGVVQPLNTTVFPISEVEKAFRFMGSGKHTGKVLLRVREEESKKVVVPSFMQVTAKTELHLFPRKSYIIIGGLGGFGVELTKWLISKGAGAIVLTSRYGARTPYHSLCLKRWQESGVKVIVSTLNVANREEAKQLLEETAAKYGPVGGIFNSAAVLRDAFIENQSASAFETVCAPKSLATKYLDELTRTLCPELDLFVCFSSISCGKGNAGQTNYGYANSVMERVCEQRKEDGLHGLAIQWGIIGDVGLVHRNMGEDAMIAGVMSQKIKSCLHSLEGFLLQGSPVVSSYVAADKSRLKERSDNILSHLAKIFGVQSLDKISPYLTFGEMGIDSMTGVELRQIFETTLDIDMSLQEIQELKLPDVIKFQEEKEKNAKAGTDVVKKAIDIEFKGPNVLLPTQAIAPLNGGKQGALVFVMHGNDLLNEKLKKLWEGISYPVFALQTTKNAPLSSLKDMALWHLNQIQHVSSCAPVHLIALSTASNLALEMALQSDNQTTTLPNIKSLAFLDGSLQLMETHTTTEQEKKKNAALYEASDFCDFLKQFSDSDLSQLKHELAQLSNLESRANMVSSLITLANKPEFMEATEFYVKKQNTLRFHVPAGRLEKDLTVIEASEKVLANDVSSVKDFLSKISTGHIAIHRLAGNNEFPFGLSVANEIADLLNKMYLT